MNPMQHIHMSGNSNEDSRISLATAHYNAPSHTTKNFQSIEDRMDKMESIVERICKEKNS